MLESLMGAGVAAMKSGNNLSYTQGGYGCSTGDYNTENVSERELSLADLVSAAYGSQKWGY